MFANGLGSAPHIFTKVMKVIFSELRAQGYESVSYIDDCWLQGKDSHLARKMCLKQSSYCSPWGL